MAGPAPAKGFRRRSGHRSTKAGDRAAVVARVAADDGKACHLTRGDSCRVDRVFLRFLSWRRQAKLASEMLLNQARSAKLLAPENITVCDRLLHDAE